MINSWKKFTCFTLSIIFALNPLISLMPEKVKAESDGEIDNDSVLTEVFDNGTVFSQTEWEKSNGDIKDERPQGIQNLEAELGADLDIQNDDDAGIPAIERITDPIVGPKLILNSDDAAAIRSLACLNDLMPNFASDTKALYAILPANSRPKNEVDLSALKISNPDKYYGYVSTAQNTWHDNNQGYILNDSSTLECMTGLSTNEIADLRSSDPERLQSIVTDSKDALTIDIRVLKTLVYLVTPKNQGGAGHYRVKVQRIRTGYTSKSRQYSRESDVIRSQNIRTGSTADTAATSTKSTDLSDKTAAEIGMSQLSSGVVIDGQAISATVEDENGDQYDAYLSNQMQNEDKSVQASQSTSQDDRNISAHVDGKAVDISEIDDIRCTLVKRKRVGKDSVSKYMQRPIKLAWQTQEGYAASGGNEAFSELGNLFKQSASEGISQLIEELGGDVSNYSGDLSSGNFSDIVQIIGKSLFSQILNSPDANLSGYNFQDTLQKLGGMYFAQFLGLPNEIFTGQNVASFDDLQRVIGQAAIEKRLDLPYGTFTGKGLEEVLLNIGQRKIEYEMNLDNGSLAGIYSNSKPNMPLLIGQAVVEKTLALNKGSFTGNNFAQLKSNVGKYKGDVLFINPSYTDSILHLDPGTTQKLKSGEMSPTAFTTLVGQIRLDDTAYGFKYLAAHDSAYNLPAGTWDGALLGQKDSLETIGSNTIAKAFATDDEQRSAIQSWVIGNTGKGSDDDCAVNPSVEVAVANETNPSETKMVPISEKKAMEAGFGSEDFYKMFGCSKSNPGDTFEKIGSKILYYAIMNYGLNPNEKAKIDLMDTNPEAKLLAATGLDFYVTRITQINDISNRIKKNWESNADTLDISSFNPSIDHIISIAGDKNFYKSAGSVKDAGRRISVEISALKASFQKSKEGSNKLTSKINATIIDLNTLSRLVSEVIEGKVVPSTDTIQVSQIPQFAFGSSASGSGSATGAGGVANNIDRVAVMLLLAGKVSPKDFFLSLGINKAEAELSLPANSINYYVRNTEKKGIADKDAFFEAIGQARIEEEFGMPEYYFQGQVYKLKDKPDFGLDIDQLLRYNDISPDNKLYESTKAYVLQAKTDNPKIYDFYLNQAQAKYSSNMEKFAADSNNNVSGKSFETTVADIASNIKANGLSDGIRSPEEDLLFRMGISGNYESLVQNSPIAWSTANKQAEDIDKKFWLKKGTTKSLFTGTAVPAANGRRILSGTDKKIIAGKLGISESAIDKYMQALNGDIDPTELTKTGQEVFYNSDNPFAEESPQPDNGECQNPFILNAKGISLSSDFVDNTFGFVDSDGLKFAQSAEGAQQAIAASPDKKIDFLTEIGAGLARLTGAEQSKTREGLLNYLMNNKQAKLFDLTDEQYSALATNSGIPEDLLKKLFTRQSATLMNKPVPAYKRAVGQAAAEKLIGWKLFSGLGIDLGATDFGPDNLYDILNGNYQSLYAIGASMIDKKLNLPAGTLVKIISAKTPTIKKCSLAEAGGSMLGKLAGLNYVSIEGNIITNFGQSKIEETLNLPRGTFGGANVDELINRVGPINFALAFKIPLDGILSSELSAGIFGDQYAAASKDISDEVKLKQIKNLVESGRLPQSSSSENIGKLKTSLIQRISDIIKSDKLNAGNEKIQGYVNNNKYLDSAFSLPAGTTAGMLSGKGATPDQYKDLVANKTIQNMAYLQALDLFGLDGYQSQAVINLVKNFKTMADKKQYGDIYSALTDIFNVNLDAKAGFTQGTFASVLNDPKNAGKVLLAEGIKQVDAQLGLDSTGNASLTGLYGIYQTNLDECKSSILSPEQEAGLNDEEIRLTTAGDSGNLDTERLVEISSIRAGANKDYTDCKQQAREAVTSTVYAGVKDAAGTAIINKISALTNGTIAMPKADIEEFVGHGDMRYFQVAGLSYAANSIINSAGNSEMLPAGMRVSYDDFKFAVLGNRDAEAAAVNAAVYASVTGTGINENALDHRYGDVCPGGTTAVSGLGCVKMDEFLKAVAPLPREGTNLTDANKSTLQSYYSYNPADASANSAADAMYQTKYGSQITIANSDECKQNPTSDACQNAFTAVNNLNTIKDDARSRSQKLFVEDLQYKSTDAMLWKLDKNAFPGLGYALLKGDAATKQMAMATYIRNGIMRGELFGIDIGINTARIGQWVTTYNFFKDIAASTASLDQFLAGDGYKFVNDFINKNASNVFGFALPPDMLGSLVVGMSTGVWKASDIKPNDSRFTGQTYKGAGGSLAIPTLAQVGKNMVESKVFGWADKTFGFDVGTSYQIYDAYRKVSQARNAYIAASSAYEKAQTTENLANAQKTGANYDGMKGQLIAMVVNIVFAKQIAAAEEKLGLVSGTGSMLVTMMITGFNPVSVAIFIAMNLFGVYKTELKCDADGYYPRIEPAPSASVADITGLGVWNGMNQNTMKQKSMQAAQYKAQRLIGDALTMQESSKFKDIIPSQIMTGRQEDVDFWDNGITEYLCSKIGNTSVKGICGGDTRAGVWKNPQTVALTHIGF